MGNIYAPNDDNPNFFKNVLSHLLFFECEDIILGGHFNLVLDVQNDKQGGRLTTHKNSLKEDQNIINSLDLIDIWRVSNPDIRRFTWRRSKPEIHCRLDFFLTSNSLSSAITKADILPGFKTVIYCITCTLCKKIYIRETGRRPADRFREHLRDTEQNNTDASKPVARHFNLPNHSHLWWPMAISGKIASDIQKNN